MIPTILAAPADRAAVPSVQWRQLVDLLAQRRAGPDREGAYSWLRRHRDSVDPGMRAESARSLAGLRVDPKLVAFFAEDAPAVAAPLIANARLSDEEWREILPRLGPTGRALLRHRRDLSGALRQSLAAFGAADFVLEGTAGVAETGNESQIRELVERIEAYRRQKDEAPVVTAPVPGGPADNFRWETGGDGVVRWVEGVPREALVGLSLATIAGPGQHGVDGQVAGAFEKRAPFRDARFSVAGSGQASGDWRISGVPWFDPAQGSFLGYRGTARRPRLDETAHAGPGRSGVFGSQFQPDALRQLVHELRTPLNAIIGFAEMIEGQYLGPAPSGYRGRAADIVDQAQRLLSAVDDLDTAARIDSDRLELDPGAVDASALITRLCRSYEQIVRERGAAIALDVAPDLPPVQVAPEAAERMFARMLAATIGLAEPDETIAAALAPIRHSEQAMVQLSIARPRAVAGLDEVALLDPGYSPEGDWPGAPALGLGFALRLVRNLAEAAGGALLIGERRIRLLLPALAEAAPLAGNGDAGV